jgi:ATP-binding cassette subfamily C (CFTR/MRP) protein 1
MVRGALVNAVFRKTTEISITSLDNSAAVTLMSTDVERIVQGLRNLNEFWAGIVQVVVATYLLERKLGVACVAPVAVSLGILSNLVWVPEIALIG